MACRLLARLSCTGRLVSSEGDTVPAETAADRGARMEGVAGEIGENDIFDGPNGEGKPRWSLPEKGAVKPNPGLSLLESEGDRVGMYDSRAERGICCGGEMIVWVSISSSWGRRHDPEERLVSQSRLRDRDGLCPGTLLMLPLDEPCRSSVAWVSIFLPIGSLAGLLATSDE